MNKLKIVLVIVVFLVLSCSKDGINPINPKGID